MNIKLDPEDRNLMVDEIYAKEITLLVNRRAMDALYKVRKDIEGYLSNRYNPSMELAKQLGDIRRKEIQTGPFRPKSVGRCIAQFYHTHEGYPRDDLLKIAESITSYANSATCEPRQRHDDV